MVFPVVGYLACLRTKLNVTTIEQEKLTPGEEAKAVSPNRIRKSN